MFDIEHQERKVNNMDKLEKMLEEVRTRNNKDNMESSLSLVRDWVEELRNNKFLDEKMLYWYYGNVEGFIWGLYASSLITREEREVMIEYLGDLFL